MVHFDNIFVFKNYSKDKAALSVPCPYGLLVLFPTQVNQSLVRIKPLLAMILANKMTSSVANNIPKNPPLFFLLFPFQYL